MAELTDELKREVARRLGAFEGCADIVRYMKEEHDLECSLQQIAAYDPTKPAFRVGEEYRQIFEVARQTYLHDVAAVPIAQQGYRLNTLQKNLSAAIKSKNIVLANATLEQAAREIGGAFSNVRINVGDMQTLTTEERKAQFARLCDAALGHDKVQTAPGSNTAQ